jgi:gluconate 5-dehydrogenase
MPTLHQLFDLTGRVAIVTGGAGLLGTAMSEALAEAGAHVVVASRTVEKCEQLAERLSAAHPRALGLRVDVTEPASVRALLERVRAEFGRVDVLVNNAYSGAMAPVEEMTVEQFEAATRGALTSTFLCCQVIGGAMAEAGRGSIINIASMFGLVSPDMRVYGRSGLNNPPNYGPAKAGVIQLTRYLACYWGSRGVRVNAISPGGFYNPRFEQRPDYLDVFVPNYCAKTPLGRMGDPTDMMGAVVYFASDASSWVTGSNLSLDGGWTAW